MKRFLAMLLAVIMTVGVCLPAYAEETGSITIKNAVPGQTYSVYQLLDLESYDAEAGAYAYKAADGWEAFVEGTDVAGVYLNTDAQGYVTWVGEETDARVAAFAKLAMAYAEANEGITPAKSIDATGDGETVAITFDNLDLGYYLVDTTLGTVCSLDTTNPNVDMSEKNSVPSIKKEVLEDATNEWGAKNDADINQVVNYQVTVTVGAGAENYVVHDTMEDGLTFLQIDSVKVNDVAVADTNYDLNTSCEDGCTFELAFTNTYIGGLEAGTEIVVSYSARLNENAVVGIEGNPNEVKLQYGDENKVTYTTSITVVTYTWDAKVIKFTKQGDGEVMLAGATFKLSSDEAGKNIIKFHSLDNNEYQVCANNGCTKTHVTEITTDSTGAFRIEGLDAGTYYLTETKAPAGYNALAGPVEVEITGAATADDGTLTYTTVETKVENKTGTELPSTGGMGTMVMYGVGALLVIGAAVLLVTRRRAGGEDQQ